MCTVPQSPTMSLPSVRPVRQASKRPLMTESAHRPQTLEPKCRLLEMLACPNPTAPLPATLKARHRAGRPQRHGRRKRLAALLSERQSRVLAANSHPSPKYQHPRPQKSTAAAPRKSKLRPPQSRHVSHSSSRITTQTAL